MVINTVCHSQGLKKLPNKGLLTLCALGIIDSLYILFTGYSCSTCNTVHNTMWGKPFGIPLAAFGLLWYALLLFAAQKGRRQTAYYLASAGVVVSMGLLYMQAAVIRQFCFICLISAALMAFIWLILLIKAGNWEEKQVITALVALAFLGTSGLYAALPAGDAGGDKTGKLQNMALAVNNHLTRITIKEKRLHNEDILLLYTSGGKPVEVKMSEEIIFFFSPSCRACKPLLHKISALPAEKRPLLVDTSIHALSSREKEIQQVQEELRACSLDPEQVLYDFDRLDPVGTIPVLLSKGKESRF